ncbi:MAG TPA: ankyrin repeat domain-containing protein [Treponemataceae bacterium]|jgi:ankyrin repeat protein|nr:ankyrin repeat domain-containing protein [Treponemataceae bacterium]
MMQRLRAIPFALCLALALFPSHAEGYEDSDDEYDGYDEAEYVDEGEWAPEGESDLVYEGPVEDPLFALVREGSASEIANSVAGSLDIRDAAGNTLLMAACEAGRDREVISILIKAGIAVDGRNRAGATALMLAAYRGNDLAPVEALIKAGARLDAVDDAGYTSLTYALLAEDPMVAAFLIGKKAGITMLDEEGKSPLHHACMNPRVVEETVRLLLKAGCDPKARDFSGATALMYAARTPAPTPVLAALVKAGAKVSDIDENGQGPLAYAVATAGVETISFLLSAGANPRASDQNGSTVLMLACAQTADPEVVRVLLKAGARVDDLDDYRYTPLFYALYNERRDDILPILFDAGAKGDARAIDGTTALMMASYFGNAALVARLVSVGASVNAADDQGKTALMYACEQNQDDSAIRALIEAGADLSLRDEEGALARDYIARNAALAESAAAALVAVE